ncbi:MAG TPA: Panacea domain-containing protein [Candidatus Dormibacteraeota bacterium]|nr:Panacea domain-containing protein [Candidatus Dormibacteraeota bacterium]
MHFNEAKATQAAARFLTLRGGRMSYMKLIKLLYLLDREALIRWGRPVTTDAYVSMDRGPVVSRIYDLITDEPSPESTSVWQGSISRVDGYEVELRNDPGANELSDAEDELVAEIFGLYGRMSRWDIVRLCHDLPEWENPQGSALPIEYRDILRGAGKTESEIARIEDELEFLSLSSCLLPSA